MLVSHGYISFLWHLTLAQAAIMLERFEEVLAPRDLNGVIIWASTAIEEQRDICLWVRADVFCESSAQLHNKVTAKTTTRVSFHEVCNEEYARKVT